MLMNRVATTVKIVDYDLDDIIVLDNKRVSRITIDFGIGGGIASRQDRVKCRDFRYNVGEIVDGETVLVVVDGFAVTRVDSECYALCDRS